MELELEIKVKLFLAQYFHLHDEERVVYRLNKKTQDFLRTIGMTQNAMSNYIRQTIQVEQYFQGPTPHHYIPDFTVMVFALPYADKILYVKFAMGEIYKKQEKQTVGLIQYMSFHPEESQMEKPLERGVRNG